MKLFKTTNIDIINNCRQYFDVELPSTLWSDRVRFEKKFAVRDHRRNFRGGGRGVRTPHFLEQPKNAEFRLQTASFMQTPNKNE